MRIHCDLRLWGRRQPEASSSAGMQADAERTHGQISAIPTFRAIPGCQQDDGAAVHQIEPPPAAMMIRITATTANQRRLRVSSHPRLSAARAQERKTNMAKVSIQRGGYETVRTRHNDPGRVQPSRTAFWIRPPLETAIAHILIDELSSDSIISAIERVLTAPEILRRMSQHSVIDPQFTFDGLWKALQEAEEVQ